MDLRLSGRGGGLPGKLGDDNRLSQRSPGFDGFKWSVGLRRELSGLGGGELSADNRLFQEHLGKSPFELGCGPVDIAELDGTLFDLGLCSPRWPKSRNCGVVGTLAWSAAFANQSSHQFCDVAVPSSATSTTLARSSCTCRTNTGGASEKLTMDRKRKIRAMAMRRHILVGIVTWIRQC